MNGHYTVQVCYDSLWWSNNCAMQYTYVSGWLWCHSVAMVMERLSAGQTSV